MEQKAEFNIIAIADNKLQFSLDKVIITVGKVSYSNGKHELTGSTVANAQFECAGKKYTVENTTGITTIEDWYSKELLPKMHMMDLLLTDISVE